MEKKKYVKPEMTVFKIDGKCQILAGSTIENGMPNGGQAPDWGEDNYVD